MMKAVSKSFRSHDRFIKGTDFSVPSQEMGDEAKYRSVARGQSCPSPRPPKLNNPRSSTFIGGHNLIP